MLVEYDSEPLYPHHEKMMKLLFGMRDDADEGTRVSINMEIILTASCWLEGFLEDLAKSVIKKHRELRESLEIVDFYTRKRMNFFYGTVEKRLSSELKRKTNARALSDYISDMLGERFSLCDEVAPLNEGISILGNLRNMIAHGREVFLENEVDEDGNVIRVLRHSPAYVESVRYLRKRGFDITETGQGFSEALFTDEVADWAVDLAHRYAQAMEMSVNEYLRPKTDDEEFEELFSDAVGEINRQSGTNYTLKQLLQQGLVWVKIEKF